MDEFSPPPPPPFYFSEPPSFFLFSYPSNIDWFYYIITKLHPPFQNPGSAPAVILRNIWQSAASPYIMEALKAAKL